MKRYSTILLLAGWLILIFVISSIAFAAVGENSSEDELPVSSQKSQITENVEEDL